jgi:hypothetical protein
VCMGWQHAVQGGWGARRSWWQLPPHSPTAPAVLQLEVEFLDACSAASSAHCAGEEQLLCALGAVSFIAVMSPAEGEPHPACAGSCLRHDDAEHWAGASWHAPPLLPALLHCSRCLEADQLTASIAGSVCICMCACICHAWLHACSSGATADTCTPARAHCRRRRELGGWSKGLPAPASRLHRHQRHAAHARPAGTLRRRGGRAGRRPAQLRRSCFGGGTLARADPDACWPAELCATMLLPVDASKMCHYTHPHGAVAVARVPSSVVHLPSGEAAWFGMSWHWSGSIAWGPSACGRQAVRATKLKATSCCAD